MKLTKPMLVGSIFFTAIAFASDANADFKKFMNSEMAKATKAFDTKDISYFEKVTTSDFSEKMDGRTYTKAQSMSEMKQLFAMAKSVKAKLKIDSTKASGNTGIAMTSGHMVVVMKPMGPKDKNTHTMVMDSWEKQTWARSGKGWKLKMIEQTKAPKMTMDGKPFNPSAAGG